MSKGNIPTYLRTDETWEAYQNAPRRDEKECFMCDLIGVTVVKKFHYWIIIENQFPYDAVAEKHHLLVPIEHATKIENLHYEDKESAIDELKDILADIEESGEYDCQIKNFTIGQSHPTHLHYHLVTWRRR